MNKKAKQPIGVFDSGVGGLTVVKALMSCLPNEDVVYFGDTARVPYGTKSRESIIRFSLENAKILLKHRVKLIVVACNSSASYAMPALRKNFLLPIIGVIEPGVKKAIRTTANKKIGIIATPATIRSGSYTRLIHKNSRHVRVLTKACPLLVPLVEEGWFDHDVTRGVARQYLAGMSKAKIDTLILGCTHYPLLKSLLKKVMGPKVSLIDSAQEVALEVKALLAKNDQAQKRHRKAKYRFLVSDAPAHFRDVAKRFLGHPVGNVKRI